MAAAAHPSPSEALWLACEQGDDAKARTLLAAARKAGSADALLLRRRHGLTLTHLAAERGHFRVLTELLASGAAADVVTAAGVTPLHLAAERGRNDAVDVLVAFGAGQPADAFGSTPLHRAAFAGHVDIVAMLLEGGAIEDARDANGHTPLHVAAHGGYDEVVRELLRGGAFPHVRDQHGQTARVLAARAGHSGVVAAMDMFLAPQDEPQLLSLVMPVLERAALNP